MRGLGGKRGATDRGPIARQQTPRSQSWTRNLRSRSLSAIQRPPAFPFGRSLEPAPTGPGTTCGLVSGVVEPPQGLQICEVSFVTTRPPPPPSVRYPNKPWIPVHRRQQDREYPDHRTSICRETGNRLGAWSAPRRSRRPLMAKGRATRRTDGIYPTWFVILPPFSRSSLRMRARIGRTA